MRTLAFDGRMGASGDMLLAALLAAGADRDALAPVETADALDVQFAVRAVEKCGISATAVDVLVPAAESDADERGHDGEGHSHEHRGEGHDHEHHGEPGHHDDDHAGHEHEHGHQHEGHTHAEGHGPTRTYAEVVEIVESLSLPADVEATALSIFEVLGEAEAAVHGTELAATAFHEVGADDAIADVVGCALLLADLDPERVVTTPLAAGGGTAETSHGTYPVPVPAVVEIADGADWSLRGGPVERELLTPTGAAILAVIADGVGHLPTLDVTGSGYGAGGYDVPSRPNVLRAVLGDGGGGLRRDEITVLETNLDDATPEVLGGLQETLTDAGARDVSIVPCTMKKARPGHLVKVIVKPEDADRVARELAAETGTLGVREHGAGHRWVADREIVQSTITVAGTEYTVDVKLASDADGAVYDVSAEYDDALAVARETGLPVRDVLRRAEAGVRD